MGVYIKDMDMPVIELDWTIRRGADGKWYAIDTNAETSDGEWHEIIPVPKHGDLIGRDALMELYADEDDLRLENMKVPISVIRQNIMDAPTIIPADKEGE